MLINPLPVYQKGTKRPRKKKENDSKYLAWLRTLPCAVCNAFPPSQACHVRLGGRGGIGIKPLFSAVPLCANHHMAQHGKGHESIMNTDAWLKLADDYLRTFSQQSTYRL